MASMLLTRLLLKSGELFTDNCADLDAIIRKATEGSSKKGAKKCVNIIKINNCCKNDDKEKQAKKDAEIAIQRAAHEAAEQAAMQKFQQAQQQAAQQRAAAEQAARMAAEQQAAAEQAREQAIQQQVAAQKAAEQAQAVEKVTRAPSRHDTRHFPNSLTSTCFIFLFKGRQRSAREAS